MSRSLPALLLLILTVGCAPAGGDAQRPDAPDGPDAGGGGNGGELTEGEGNDGGEDLPGEEEDPARAPTRLILHQQSPPPLWTLVENQREIDALPFDGTTFTIPASFSVHGPEPVTVEQLRSQLSEYAALDLQHVTAHWLMVYAAPAGPLSAYDTVIQNFANLAQVAGEVGIAGIFYDTEEYFGDTWSTSILGPGMTESTVRTAATERGREVMAAMAERWPELRILITLGPWVAEPLSAAPQFLGEACLDDHGLVFNIAHASQGMGAFTLGIALESLDHPATFLDGAEIYTQRTLADWERSHTWISEGFPTHSDRVPAPLKAAYAAQVEVAQASYDFPSEYRCKGPTGEAEWEADVTHALQTSDSIAWAYSERFEWVGNLNSGKPLPPPEWLEATRRGKAAGQAPTAP